MSEFCDIHMHVGLDGNVDGKAPVIPLTVARGELKIAARGRVGGCCYVQPIGC